MGEKLDIAKIVALRGLKALAKRNAGILEGRARDAKRDGNDNLAEEYLRKARSCRESEANLEAILGSKGDIDENDWEGEEFEEEFEEEDDKNTQTELTEPAASLPVLKDKIPNIILLGQKDHGKTTLLSALTKLFGKNGYTDYRNEDLDTIVSYKLICQGFSVEIQTDKRRYLVYDFNEITDIIKGLILTDHGEIVNEFNLYDGAILVISAADGPMPQTREHILLARQVGVPIMAVYMNKADQEDDPELIELVEMEARELLSSYDFPGDEIPFVVGSALEALKGDEDQIPSIRKLMDEIDLGIKTPENVKNKPFFMPIANVFNITGRGTVVTGHIERGTIHVGDPVEVIGMEDDIISTHVVGVEMLRKLWDCAEPGDNVGLLLRGVAFEEVERGMALVEPGSANAYSSFTALVYLLTDEENGANETIFDGCRPQFYFHTTDVTGVITLLEETTDVFGIYFKERYRYNGQIIPGEFAYIHVNLIVPLAMECGTVFLIRSNHETVAIGTVIRDLS